METHYQKPREVTKREIEDASSLSHTTDHYISERENLFREVYSNISLFEKLMYEATQGAGSKKRINDATSLSV